MEKVKVSILVPICNVEKFLGKCLQSLVNQTLKDIEIVCINDGSKDNSLKIIQEYAKKDNRIVVIDKPNSGYGDSMNKGLEISRGEYIGIVESDDFVEANMFEQLYKLSKEYNADVAKSNFNFYWENPRRVVFCNNISVERVDSNAEKNRKNLFWGMPAIWSALYKKSFLVENSIGFLPTPGASYQDTSFNFKVACAAKNIVLIPKAYLYYRQDNSNSSVKNASMEKVYCLHKEWDEAIRYLEERNLNEYLNYYHTLKFNGLMWNYSRIDNENRKVYFEELRKEFSDCAYININHIPKYCKYGGLFAIRHNVRLMLDFMLWLRKLVKG